MEQVAIQFLLTLLRWVPTLITAVEESRNLSEAQKKVEMEKLSDELDVVKARVAAVKFRDV